MAAVRKSIWYASLLTGVPGTAAPPVYELNRGAFPPRLYPGEERRCGGRQVREGGVVTRPREVQKQFDDSRDTLRDLAGADQPAITWQPEERGSRT
jgi:hypothetical protein